ncbi:Acetoacetate decarboxylase [Penicillium hordei]|uniref:Acetoacetate decarboxylase n=1 Tax=Penicillium hordei TaxID=40994 RepID=A0AAD6E1L8_9EURO|nr:Acetoacetate decarboxylase [Penicillium hordei]KAJ5598857.1 Acetoacetate decarboxylase [Penicillium hordei]
MASSSVWGVFAEQFGANPMEQPTHYSATGELQRVLDLTESNKKWQHPWLLAHRIDPHNNLKGIATTAMKTHKAIPLRTDDGSKFQGDVVLGADGVHSVTRHAVPGGQVRAECRGKSAFRFMVSKEVAMNDPVTAKLVQHPGELSIWYCSDARIIMYPTSHNTVLNFVAIHPENKSAADTDDSWGQQGKLEKMLQIFDGFDPTILRFLGKVDPQSVKVWKLLDMDLVSQCIITIWLCLGTRPILSYRITDGISLAVVLSPGISTAEVPKRLKLYHDIRHERVTHIQEYSRIIGEDRTDDNQLDIYSFTNFNFGHDEWDNSTQCLREWTWNQISNPYWRMPIAFSQMPGPRQTHLGVPRDGTKSTFTTVNQVQDFANRPAESVPAWLQRLAVHTSRYHCLRILLANKAEQDGVAMWLPVLFESLTNPIVSGREELSMPNLYTSVDVYCRSRSYRIRTGWEGALWGNLLEDLVEVGSSTTTGALSGEADAGILAYKYLPKSGRANKNIPAEEYAIFDPFSKAVPTPKPQRVYTTDKASIQIDVLDWQQLPTLYHVISRLADVPAFEIVGAKVVEGEGDGVPDVLGAGPIE